jgi:hypothetical protein
VSIVSRGLKDLVFAKLILDQPTPSTIGRPNAGDRLIGNPRLFLEVYDRYRNTIADARRLIWQ